MIETSLHQSEPVMLPGRPFGRVVRSILGYSLMTALMIITPLLVFVPAALFHCAIRNGRRAAWGAFAGALAIASLYLATMPAASAAAAKLAWATLAGMALGIMLPAMAALPLVERGEKLGRVLMVLLITGAIGLGLTELGSRALLDFSPYVAQVADAKRAEAQLVKDYRSSNVPAAWVQTFQQWTQGTVQVLPALMLISVVLTSVLSLLMFGRLKAWRELTARRGDNDAFGAYLFRNLSLPDWLLFAFIFGGLTPLAHGMLQKVALNVLVVTVFLYMLQGLAIFRYMLLAIGASPAGTALGWLLLVFLMFSVVGFFLLAVAGLFDPFFDFRHFKKRKDDSHESHSD